MDAPYDFMKLAQHRFSVRKFSDKQVAKADINSILGAGHIAPTAHNNQPQRILVINSKEGIEKLQKCTVCHFGAPAAMIIGYDKDECWKRGYDGQNSGEVDASIVTTHMMLQAAAIGVGTTWVMYFDPEAMRAEFAIPDTIQPVALLVMGYPAGDCKPSPSHAQTRPMKEVVFYEQLKHK